MKIGAVRLCSADSGSLKLANCFDFEPPEGSPYPTQVQVYAESHRVLVRNEPHHFFERKKGGAVRLGIEDSGSLNLVSLL